MLNVVVTELPSSGTWKRSSHAVVSSDTRHLCRELVSQHNPAKQGSRDFCKGLQFEL